MQKMYNLLISECRKRFFIYNDTVSHYIDTISCIVRKVFRVVFERTFQRAPQLKREDKQEIHVTATGMRLPPLYSESKVVSRRNCENNGPSRKRTGSRTICVVCSLGNMTVREIHGYVANQIFPPN